MKKSKLSPVLLTGSAALVIAAAGCSSQSSPAPAAGESGKPAEEKTVVYQFMRNMASPEYPADGGEARTVIRQELEKAGIRGLDYKVTLASGDEYNTKLNLLATSKQLPDYFDIDPITLTRFVEQGLLQPIDEHLKLAPNVVKLIPKAYWDRVTFNGKIYAIPNGTRPEAFNYPTATGWNVRQDWLNNLGLKSPATLDELHDVLKAFVTQDPDKNGKNDTIGLGAHKKTIFDPVFGAFGVIPSFWTERDGMIKKGFVLPETKMALAVLQQWYKEGLIDHDFPIMETKQMQEKIVNSIAGVWDGDGYYTEKGTNATAGALNQANPNAVVAMLEAPQGPDGKRGYQEANALANAPLRALSANAQDPQKLFQFLNWLAGDGAELMLFGVEGKDYTYDKATNSINMTTSFSDLYKKGYSNPIRMILNTDRRYAKPPVREAIEIVNKNLIENRMWNNVPAENDYPDVETKLWQEYFIKIVTGVYTVDKHDEFVTKYYQQGGKEIEKQANELWQKLKK